MKKVHFILILLVGLGLVSAYAIKSNIHKSILGEHSSIIVLIEKTLGHNPPSFSKSMVGKIAPAFNLPSSTGANLALDDFQGKLILLNFWASWCPPCRAEIPGFIKTQNKYKDKPFTFIGIAIEDKASVMEYAKEVGINYPITHGVEEAYKVASDYGDPDGALPYSILISPDKKILEVFAGFLSEERLEKLINKNLPTN